MKPIKFKINGHKWEIWFGNTEKLKSFVATAEQREPYFVYGYTYYPTQKIFINDDCDYDVMITTLKHELAHCYLWTYGFREVEYDVEIVCDVVAGSIDFINDIVKKFRDTY